MKEGSKAESLQATHGGRIHAAQREFGLPLECFIDFSANLNVLAPSVSEDAWTRLRTSITRYPEADAASIREQLSRVYRMQPGQILPTAGAIEGLYLVARLFAKLRVAIVEPAFSDYFRAFKAAGNTPGRVVLPPANWNRPIPDFADRLAPFDVVVLGNPNNPTGSFHTRAALSELLNRQWAKPKTWIVDEAFIEFVEDGESQSLLGVLAGHRNLLVLRSLTKSWNIPGLRLGFLATSNERWLSDAARMQPPWSIGSPTEAWASETLTPERHLTILDATAQLRQAKAEFTSLLSTSVEAIAVHPSAANFLLIELCSPELDSERLYHVLGRNGILVRICDSFYGMPKGRFIRVAVRTPAENRCFVKILRAAVHQLRKEAAA